MLIMEVYNAIIYTIKLRWCNMNVNVGDILVMKKQHPCGGREFEVLRIGVDFKIKCTKCGREVMVARTKVEKNIRAVKNNTA